jgi:hypothetical protein
VCAPSLRKPHNAGAKKNIVGLKSCPFQHIHFCSNAEQLELRLAHNLKIHNAVNPTCATFCIANIVFFGSSVRASVVIEVSWSSFVSIFIAVSTPYGFG